MKTKLIRLRMKLPIKPALACFAAFVIGGCASTTTAPSTPPAATVRIQEWTAAYYGSAAAGKGTLYYNGRRHHFAISGLGAGGMGGQKIAATGMPATPMSYAGVARRA